MISILTPSRGRPANYKRFCESVRNTAKGNVELLGYVDRDDPTQKDYPHDILIMGSDCAFGERWNRLAQVAEGDILIMGNDDLVYQTEGWDEILLEQLKQFPDNIYCCYFNDGINGEKHCAFPIISRKWMETVGHFSPTCFNFFYHDTWVMDVARKIGRLHYIPDVLIEHRHFTNKKAPKDATYMRNRQNNISKKDAKIFADTDLERVMEATKLRKVMI